MEKISERFQYLLDSKKITIYGVSERTGISQSSLGRIIKEDATPNNKNRKKIALLFGISENWLVYGEEDSVKDNSDSATLRRFKESVISKLLTYEDLNATYMVNGAKKYTIRELIGELNEQSDVGVDYLKGLIDVATDLIRENKISIGNMKLS